MDGKAIDVHVIRIRDNNRRERVRLTAWPLSLDDFRRLIAGNTSGSTAGLLSIPKSMKYSDVDGDFIDLESIDDYLALKQHYVQFALQKIEIQVLADELVTEKGDDDGADTGGEESDDEVVTEGHTPKTSTGDLITDQVQQEVKDEKAKKITEINHQKKLLKSRKRDLKIEAKKLQDMLEKLVEPQGQTGNPSARFQYTKERAALNAKLREVNTQIAATKDDITLLKQEKAIVKGQPISEYIQKKPKNKKKKSSPCKCTGPKPPPGLSRCAEVSCVVAPTYGIDIKVDSSSMKEFGTCGSITIPVQLKNTGSLPWTKKTYLYEVTNTYSEAVKTPALAPGEVVCITLVLRNPKTEGKYTATFQAKYQVDGESQDFVNFGSMIDVNFTVTEPKVARAAPPPKGLCSAPPPGLCGMMRSDFSRELCLRAEKLKARCQYDQSKILDVLKLNKEKNDDDILSILNGMSRSPAKKR